MNTTHEVGNPFHASLSRRNLNPTYYVLLLSMLIGACQSRHYGHLSKVRVKQKQEIAKDSNPTQVKTDPAFTSSEEPISASLEAKSLIKEIPSSLPKISPEKGAIQQETTQEQSAPKSKKDSKVKRRFEEPVPDKLNIPAYVGAALSLISLISIPIDVFTGDGYATIISFLLSIPILILGYAGLARVKKKKSKTGKGLAIFAIVTGFLLIALFLTLVVLLLLFLFSGGYGYD